MGKKIMYNGHADAGYNFGAQVFIFVERENPKPG